MEGKLYFLWSEHIDKIYIGSTMRKSINDRLYEHKKDYKLGRNTTSKELFKYGDCHIEIIETFNNITKKELAIIEGIYIKNCDNAVNYRIAGRTQKEYYKDRIIMKQKNKLKLN